MSTATQWHTGIPPHGTKAFAAAPPPQARSGRAAPRPIRSRSASLPPSPVPTPRQARLCSAAQTSRSTEINAAGGVLGRQLALVIRDNEHKLDRGVAQTRELIEREGCAAILGSQGSFIGAGGDRYHSRA